MESKTKPNIQGDFTLQKRDTSAPPKISDDRHQFVKEVKLRMKNDISPDSSKSDLHQQEPQSPIKNNRRSFITETRPALERAARSVTSTRKTTGGKSRPRSVKVRRPLENGHTKFSCKCPACKIQARERIGIWKYKSIYEDFDKLNGTAQTFTWMLHRLCEGSAKIGIFINVPETVVFKAGKPFFLVQQGAKDGFLKMITQGERLQMHEIRKNFTDASRLRRLEKSKVLPEADYKYGTETVTMRHTYKDADNDDMTVEDEEGPLRVMLHKDFINLITNERRGSPIWKKIVYFQTVVKSRMGIGEPIIINYMSHLRTDKEEVDKLKEAGFQENLEHEQKLMYNNPREYCMVLCRRISFFLAIFFKLELIRMEAEFSRDDNGKIWFTYATKILVEPVTLSDIDEDLVIHSVSLISKEAEKKSADYDLGNAFTDDLTDKSQRIAGEMDSYYENIKDKAGINELLKDDPPDTITNQAFAKLRPNSPYTFEQLLHPKCDRLLVRKYLFNENIQMKRSSAERQRTRPVTAMVSRNFESQSTNSRSTWMHNSKIRISPEKKGYTPRYAPPRRSVVVSRWTRSNTLKYV